MSNKENCMEFSQLVEYTILKTFFILWIFPWNGFISKMVNLKFNFKFNFFRRHFEVNFWYFPKTPLFNTIWLRQIIFFEVKVKWDFRSYGIFLKSVSREKKTRGVVSTWHCLPVSPECSNSDHGKLTKINKLQAKPSIYQLIFFKCI